MRLDLRFPIGLLLAIIGLLLTAYGLLSDPEVYRRSLGININLWWGLVLLFAGAIMLLLARQSHKGAGRRVS